MSSTQTRFLDTLESKLAEDGFDMVRNGDWANTGTVYAVAPDALDAAGATLRYDFQNTGFSFKDAGRGAGHFFVYVDLTRPGRTSQADALSKIVDALIGISQ